MSYVIKHPSGQYVREWSTRGELVPPGSASSYRKRSEAVKVAARLFPDVAMQVHVR
jgi:hypothetical protein